jgi:hypothetical protein
MNMTLQQILSAAVRKTFGLAFIGAAAAFTFDTVNILGDFNKSASKSKEHIPYEMAAMVAFGGCRYELGHW